MAEGDGVFDAGSSPDADFNLIGNRVFCSFVPATRECTFIYYFVVLNVQRFLFHLNHHGGLTVQGILVLINEFASLCGRALE